MSRPSLSYLRLLVLLAALLLCVYPTISAPSPKDGKDDNKDDDRGKGKDDDKDVISVKGGESIQKAIDNAKKGARIEVYGKHEEQVEITTDSIELIGKNAVLVPPRPYKKNHCTGLSKEYDAASNGGADTNAGICIYGDVKLNNTYVQFDGHKKVLDVRNPIKEVKVSGFEIVGFNGQSIAIYGGKDVKISHNKLKQGGRYGLLTAGSKGTKASNNIIIGSSPVSLKDSSIAMCMDDFSPAEFSDNDVSDYSIGLCTETNGGVNKNNKIHGCCLGNVIDPGVKESKSINNRIFDWNHECDPTAAVGIILLGATDAIIKGNKIDNIVTGQAPGGAGLLLGDFFGPVNEGNTITENVFGKNDVDIFDDSAGKNDIRNNKCDLAARGPATAPTPAPEFCQ